MVDRQLDSGFSPLIGNESPGYVFDVIKKYNEYDCGSMIIIWYFPPVTDIVPALSSVRYSALKCRGIN